MSVNWMPRDVREPRFSRCSRLILHNFYSDFETSQVSTILTFFWLVGTATWGVLRFELEERPETKEQTALGVWSDQGSSIPGFLEWGQLIKISVHFESPQDADHKTVRPRTSEDAFPVANLNEPVLISQSHNRPN